MDDLTFQALRRNDATVTEVICHFPFFPLSLTAALDGNTHVRNLTLYFGPIDFTGREHLLEEHQHLRSYIKQAKSLRKIRYSVVSGFGYLGEWIDAVAASTNIDEFELESWLGVHPTVSPALVGLVRTTQSIKKLRLQLGDHIGEVVEELKNNTKLESFSVENVSVESVQSVLDALLGHCSISRFELGMFPGTGTEITPFLVMESLFALLRTRSILTEMSLCGFNFDDTGVQQLLQGLHSNRTISKLALKSCYFTSAAEEAFVSYMQERNGRDDGHLQRLHMAFCRTDRLEDQWTDKFPARMLKGPRSSALTSATFANAMFTGFWEILEEDTEPQSRSLTHLRLNQTYDSNLEAAVRHIPTLSYLRTLEWHTNDGLRNYQSLLPAFRKNGSLHSAVVRQGRVGSEWAVWNPKEERQIKAWGERNRCLPELLMKCGAKSSDEHAMGQEKKRGSSDIDPSPSPTASLGQSLSTKLFAVALQTPRMALHHCFHGITTMGDSIGCDGQSRIRTLPDEEATDSSFALERPKKRACSNL